MFVGVLGWCPWERAVSVYIFGMCGVGCVTVVRVW